MSAVQHEADEGPEILINDTSDHAKAVEYIATPSEEQTEDYAQIRSHDDEEEEEENFAVHKANDASAQAKNHEAPRTIPSTPKRYNGLERPSSADGSASVPDDTPSAPGSFASSPSRRGRAGDYSRSPTPSLRTFDRRFSARIPTPASSSSRPISPAFLNTHSRQSSTSYSISAPPSTEIEAPWEVVRWAKLRKITGQAFSEIGKRQFGRPTCIAVSASIALGTSKGLILVFDYNQNLKSIIGQGTKATESGAVSSISISADHSTIAGGHASGNIFTWELNRPAKPFLHIPPSDNHRATGPDGHVENVAILHIGFLGIRHTALASADDRGMAFSHLASRGMGSVGRSVKTTRILGRYPDRASTEIRQKKPSSVLAFSPLPLGNAEHAADSMGLVAMLTPYLLVIVSTMPIAQTQYKSPRSKEVAPHGTMTAALAWFPSVRLKSSTSTVAPLTSKAKLVYCWSNILMVLDIHEVETSEPSAKSDLPSLQFTPRSKWKAQEAIVAVQWLSRSVLALLTITQQLIILEDVSMTATDSSDLIFKHIYHRDVFSRQLDHLVDQLEDEEISSMHGVVADAFYMSFRAYKGRLFLLGFNEVSFGTLSNWADRLLALMEDGNFIAAIRLATTYYTGDADKVAVGLPEDNDLRHRMVQEKILEMMTASLKYSLGPDGDPAKDAVASDQLEDLALACITACIGTDEMDFLFEDVFPSYQDGGQEGVLLDRLEPFITDDAIVTMPPVVLKRLVEHFTANKRHARLEEILCHLDPRTMDIDQVTALCKTNHLYDALLYVWSQGIGDYTTILGDLLESDDAGPTGTDRSKIFPYLSYTLTGRIYPIGKEIEGDGATLAKAEIYAFFFSGHHLIGASTSPTKKPNSTSKPFSNLRKVLDFDALNFMSMLNEAFEDSFLNGPQERMDNEMPGQLSENLRFGLSVNRQWIVSILLEIITASAYGPQPSLYLGMFIARNLPKFPQFILLPGHVLHDILIVLCRDSDEDMTDDCELSVEYLLSMYQPPDIESLIPLIHAARFFRVLKSIYKTEGQYANLLRTCFEDVAHPDVIFECIGDFLRPSAGLNKKQLSDFHAVMIEYAHELVDADVIRAASVVNRYSPELHKLLLNALDDNDLSRYLYLKTILEPEEDVGNTNFPPKYIEQYIRLLCEYHSTHVSKFVEHLKTGDVRLEEVLPALEEGGAIDAAVVLLAREGRVRDGLNRLSLHVRSLESALSGLIDGLHQGPDVHNAIEASQDLIASIQKYTRVAIWLCRGQTARAHRTDSGVPRRSLASAIGDALSTDEEFWLELTDLIVDVTRNVTDRLNNTDEMDSSGTQDDNHSDFFNSQKLVADLRTVVQETFTALLSATTPPRTGKPTKADTAFLRILQAFLGRASRNSPSISSLRSVLSMVFSAYSHEESLLSLSNRLLDNDLFVHITEADKLRRRGWRPLGQTCEGCGRRVWGPGTGGYVWDAWKRNSEQSKSGRSQRGNPSRSSSRDSRSSKGKEVTRNDWSQSDVSSVPGEDNNSHGSTGAIVIFSCRHMFHRECLERMRGDSEDAPERENGREFACPLET